MNDQYKDLPPLPEPKYCADDLTDIFTADQMRDYALAALARHCAAPVAEAQPVGIVKVGPYGKLIDWYSNEMALFAIPAGTEIYLTPPAPQEVEQARDAGDQTVDRIALTGALQGAELALDGTGRVWVLRRDGANVRYLDQFERDFVFSAIAASLAAMAAQPADDGKAGA